MSAMSPGTRAARPNDEQSSTAIPSATQEDSISGSTRRVTTHTGPMRDAATLATAAGTSSGNSPVARSSSAAATAASVRRLSQAE
jgi:hypothetical protein